MPYFFSKAAAALEMREVMEYTTTLPSALAAATSSSWVIAFGRPWVLPAWFRKRTSPDATKVAAAAINTNFFIPFPLCLKV
jgi:hypothetical protein